MADHASSGARPRPLSPHLQIYRWSPTMATSIVHRATGMALALGIAVLAWWLMALASGPDAYALFTRLTYTPLGQIIVFGFVWSLCFHLLNGFRHLIWDIGHGFQPKTANRVSVLIILLSVVLALGLFWAGYAKMGMI
jgi:succinate dehydrogenase / fumarate reductase cytochrome b subunit